VGGLLFGDQANGPRHFRPTKDRRALWRLLKALSEPNPTESKEQDSLHGALQRAEKGAITGSLIFVIADFNLDTANLETTLGSLCQRHTLVLLPVDDPADRELPDLERAVFSGPDGALVEIDTGDPAGRAAYRQEWERHRNTLLGIANRLGMLTIPLRTDEDVHKSLLRGFQFSARTRILR